MIFDITLCYLNQINNTGFKKIIFCVMMQNVDYILQFSQYISNIRIKLKNISKI